MRNSSCKRSGAARRTRYWLQERLARGPDDILVMFADTPLVTPHTLRRMRAALAQGAALVVLGFRPAEPQGYGRIVMAGGEAVAIREELDAGSEERKIDLCNAGLMAFAGATALAALDRIGSDNRKGEFYLTDAVAIVRAMGGRAVVIETEEEEVRASTPRLSWQQRKPPCSSVCARRHWRRASPWLRPRLSSVVGYQLRA